MNVPIHEALVSAEQAGKFCELYLAELSSEEPTLSFEKYESICDACKVAPGGEAAQSVINMLVAGGMLTEAGEGIVYTIYRGGIDAAGSPKDNFFKVGGLGEYSTSLLQAYRAVLDLLADSGLVPFEEVILPILNKYKVPAMLWGYWNKHWRMTQLVLCRTYRLKEPRKCSNPDCDEIHSEGYLYFWNGQGRN